MKSKSAICVCKLSIVAHVSLYGFLERIFAREIIGDTLFRGFVPSKVLHERRHLIGYVNITLEPCAGSGPLASK